MKRLLLLACLGLISCSSPPAQQSSVEVDAAGFRLKPDPVLTPGANDPSVVIDDLTIAELCRSGYTKSLRHDGNKVRAVSASTRKAIFAEYGIDPKDYPPRTFEIDHLCSLELGCNNSPKNLWPQAYTSSIWNAHRKDRLEGVLHGMVCRGDITLREAQVAISTDWIAAYEKYIGDDG